MSAPDQKTLKDAVMADVRLVQAILRRWDPINVEPGVVAPADEYDSYAPHIVSMVKGGCTAEVLGTHLEHLASETMGLGPSNPLSRADSLKFAAEIVVTLRPSNKSLERTREG
jgi:hypothetical protein